MSIEQVIFSEDFKKRVDTILREYMKAQSFTFTEREKEAETFLMEMFGSMDYFKKNPNYFGTYAIDGDKLKRAVSYAMVRGKGNNTVVLVHHNDVVGIEDFKLLKSYAFEPEELYSKLERIKSSLGDETKQDMESQEFMFGRGVADMKGGGAIQIALLEQYSGMKDFQGNVIVIAVPDEENLSAGMRAGVSLLAKLKKEYGFEYKMMINSEPHQRKDFKKGVFSIGSVGKVMPFIYARGYLSHVGKVYEGFNPLNVMAEIVRRTELNISFSDIVANEMAPPPTWLYLKDFKNQYDVSMPHSIGGCFSVLTLQQEPPEILAQVKNICKEACDKVVSETSYGYKVFSSVKNIENKKLPWKPKVVSFKELVAEAKSHYGLEFKEAYNTQLDFLLQQTENREMTIIECNFQIVEFVYEYIDDIQPRVVYGLLPPYYPNVCNDLYKGLEERAESLPTFLREVSMKEFGQDYEVEKFYTGISDLSYTSIPDGDKIEKTLAEGMPLYGDFYKIPFDDIKNIAMPCINIGPWGKDFHKLTERVNKEDLYYRTPRLLDEAIRYMIRV